MVEKYVYLCDNSFEGILSAVYQAYEEAHGHENNYIQIAEGAYNQELFASYIPVKTNYETAAKVARTLQNRVSQEVYEFLQKSSVAYQREKADAIYRGVILALKMGTKVLDYLTEPNISYLMALERQVGNEIQRELQFLRFEELKNGFLFARINPKSAVLPYMAEHFSDRFSGENWMIVDSVHNGVLLHEAGKGCSLSHVDDVDFDAITLNFSEGEEKWQELWKMFVDTIAIRERINSNLQRQMLPLRYRKYMKEFS